MNKLKKFQLTITSKTFNKCIGNTILKLLFTIIFTLLPIIIIFIKSIAINLDGILIDGFSFEQIFQDVKNKVTFSSLYTYVYAFLVSPIVAIFTKKENSKFFLTLTFITCLIMSLFIAFIDENIVLNKKSFYCLLLFSVIPI